MSYSSQLQEIREYANAAREEERGRCIGALQFLALDALEHGMESCHDLLTNIADALAQGLTPEKTLELLHRRHEEAVAAIREGA